MPLLCNGPRAEYIDDHGEPEGAIKGAVRLESVVDAVSAHARDVRLRTDDFMRVRDRPASGERLAGAVSCGVLERDRGLLDAFRRGDREALTRVFRHHIDDVARTLRAGVVVEVDGRRTRVGQRLPEPEVEALVQETFARAFAPQARAGYDGLRPYGAWLATIARNLLIDRARREQRSARFVPLDDAEALGLAADGPEDPAWGLEEQQLAGLVAGMKASLEEPDLSIFRLRFEQQRSFRETAEALGVTDIVVRRRDTRLRAKLLELLRSAGFLEHARVRIGASLLRRSDKQTG